MKLLLQSENIIFLWFNCNTYKGNCHACHQSKKLNKMEQIGTTAPHLQSKNLNEITWRACHESWNGNEILWKKLIKMEPIGIDLNYCSNQKMFLKEVVGLAMKVKMVMNFFFEKIQKKFHQYRIKWNKFELLLQLKNQHKGSCQLVK